MNISLEQLPYDPHKLYEKPLVELTQSAVSAFLACPQKFVFRYLMLLDKRSISIPLIVGSSVHRGLECLLAPTMDGAGSVDRVAQAETAIDDYYDNLLVKKADVIIGLEDKIDHSRAVSHALINAWYIIHGDVFTEWKFLEREMKVRVEPGTTIQDPFYKRMAGMIDGVVQTPDGRIWLLEHKTRRSIQDLKFAGLQLNLQALWYLIMCRAWAFRQGKNYRPVGFYYDAMQKPQHKLNDSGWKDLKSRMIDAVVADPDKYLAQLPIEVEEEIVMNAFSNFERIIARMDGLNPGTVYKNFNACEDYGGCPYRPLCRHGADAKDPMSVLAMPESAMYEIIMPHTELEEGELDTGDVEKWTPTF